MSNPKKTKSQEKRKKSSSTKGDPYKKKIRDILLSNTKFIYILVVLFVLILYGVTYDHSFVIDDSLVLKDNKYTTQGVWGIWDILSKHSFHGVYGETAGVMGGRYRPLSIVTFAIEHSLFGGLNPMASHIINILLYALTGVLLYWVLRKLLRKYDPILPLLTTLFFMAHPIHTEVVANIKSRDEIMGFLFLLPVLFWQLKFYDNKNRFSSQNIKLLLLSSLFFFMALLSKENAITFLAVVPMALFIYSTKANLVKVFKNTLNLLSTAVFYIIMRHMIVSSSRNMNFQNLEVLNDPFLHATSGEKFATIMDTFGRYFKLLIFPHPLTSDYQFNQIPLSDWGDIKVWLVLAGTLGLLWYAFSRFLKRDIVAWSVAYFFVTFSIVSNVFFPIGILMAERFLYFPSLGFCLVLAFLCIKIPGLFSGFSSEQKVKGAIVITALILIPYSVKTIKRSMEWKDVKTLYAADVVKSPKSVVSLNRYAVSLIDQLNKKTRQKKKESLLKEAEDTLKKAVKIYDSYYLDLQKNKHFTGRLEKYSRGYTNLVRVYTLQHRFELARETLEKLKKMRHYSRNVEALSHILNKAENEYFLANSEEFRSLDDLVKQMFEKKNYLGAIPYLERLVSIHPNYDKGWFYLGGCYYTFKRTQEAKKAWLEVYRLDPYNKELHQALQAVGVKVKRHQFSTSE